MQRRTLAEVAEAASINILDQMGDVIAYPGLSVVLGRAPQHVHHRSRPVGNVRSFDELPERDQNVSCQERVVE